MKKTITILLAALMAILLLAACGPREIPPPPGAGDDITPADYAEGANWLALPEETPLAVDVFYLYPTAWAREEGEDYVCPIDHAGMREGAQRNLSLQASAYETAGNVFAPYYRQLDATYLLTLPTEEQEQYIEGVPYTDVVAAFEYYLEHHSGGRPFILAGHSQGSSMIRALLIKYMADHPEVYERMVAAYVIGYSITGDDLAANPHLTFAEGPEDVGVIISYNTEAPQVDGESPVVLPGSVAINPISWTRGPQVAPAEDNLGSLLQGADGSPERVEALADAAVDEERGVVVCSTVDPDTYSIPGMEAIFPKGVYHGQDYPFYYYNLRENAERRAAAFLAGQP